mmetsp:Transcript_36711/g.44878  ORF Transcript_36711/g.44878 Transcript_36711/m.44878 type:complete len:219 (-) Transcript_36711:76-732(-)
MKHVLGITVTPIIMWQISMILNIQTLTIKRIPILPRNIKNHPRSILKTHIHMQIIATKCQSRRLCPNLTPAAQYLRVHPVSIPRMNTAPRVPILTKIQHLVIFHDARHLIGRFRKGSALGTRFVVCHGVEVEYKQFFHRFARHVQHPVANIDPFTGGIVQRGVLPGKENVRRPVKRPGVAGMSGIGREDEVRERPPGTGEHFPRHVLTHDGWIGPVPP